MNDTIKKLAQEWKEADTEWRKSAFTEEAENAWQKRAKKANILAMCLTQELGL